MPVNRGLTCIRVRFHEFTPEMLTELFFQQVHFSLLPGGVVGLRGLKGAEIEQARKKRTV